MTKDAVVADIEDQEMLGLDVLAVRVVCTGWRSWGAKRYRLCKARFTKAEKDVCK
ncbi:hypothetical protein DPMN_164815 [Dreissena polymorpha]|uniref:Uncharacterized protein n=1 Tax=Dreissena polymorpha TaxID=45954 RepID=A0A9D4EVP4_DREPO|nr:hypothetical protein DPMN_164815 [Dreissena polymorpha]